MGIPAFQLQEIYRDACKRHRCRPNSALLAQLVGEVPLVVMDFSDNYVGAERVLACVLEVIRANVDLQVLNLSNNFLSSQCITLLVEILLPHPSISRLILLNNKFYIEAGRQLLRLVRGNRNLVEVTLLSDFHQPLAGAGFRIGLGESVSSGWAHRTENTVPAGLFLQLAAAASANYKAKMDALASSPASSPKAGSPRNRLLLLRSPPPPTTTTTTTQKNNKQSSQSKALTTPPPPPPPPAGDAAAAAPSAKRRSSAWMNVTTAAAEGQPVAAEK